ncbi:hypothetical protein D3C72_1012310 [compost metagenome]
MTEGDARAVRVDLGRVEVQFLADGAGLGGEGDVGFDHVQVGDGQAGALERQAGGRDRAQAHEFRFDAGVGVADQAGEGFQVIGLDRVAAGHDQCGGAVVQARGVAGGDRTVLLERRLHCCQLFQGRGARMFVDAEQFDAFAILDFHGRDLLAEVAVGNRVGRALLVFESQGVLHFAGDAVARGDVLGGDAHVDAMEGVMQDAEHVVDDLGVAHARTPTGGRHQVRATAHGFGTGTDDDVGIAEHQGLGGVDDRLQARTAQAVDVVGRGFLRDAGVHRRDAGDVGIAGFGRDHVAHHQMANERRVHGGSLQGGFHGRGREVGQRHVLERTTEGTDGGTGGADDVDFWSVHGWFPFGGFLSVLRLSRAFKAVFASSVFRR